jgi:hypothetical protein
MAVSFLTTLLHFYSLLLHFTPQHGIFQVFLGEIVLKENKENGGE